MDSSLREIESKAHGSSRGFIPGNLNHRGGNADDVRLLVTYPTPADHARVNSVIDGGRILDVQFILPAVFVGVDEVLAQEKA